MKRNPYDERIESAEEFLLHREGDISLMGEDLELRAKAIDLQVLAAKYRFGYQQLWCGVPVIRLPEDILLLQEIVHDLRPSCIVETGVARGGSLLLNASLMEISGLSPAVFGIDILILPHAIDAIARSRYSKCITLLEADSCSSSALQSVRSLVDRQSGADPVLLILDSNHSHDHVLGELRNLAPLLPLGSMVIVADTLIEDMPDNFYVGRPWSKGSNPLTALRLFLSENRHFAPISKWGHRGLLSEFRNGVIRRTS